MEIRPCAGDKLPNSELWLSRISRISVVAVPDLRISRISQSTAA
jgi:hypothetical protein